jgi:hypothetical protein
LTSSGGTIDAIAEMMMAGKPRAECKIVSEATWALARADYLAGMTAPAVAERHGMAVGGLRGRIAREGWSKKGHAARNAPPPEPAAVAEAPIDPDGISRAALRRASAALAGGRPEEAKAVVAALEDVLELAGAVQFEAEGRMNLDEAVHRFPHLEGALWDYAAWLAERLLEDGEVPERYARRAFAWRAARLGPEAAARDRLYADGMGWSGWLYDAEGELTPEQDEKN